MMKMENGTTRRDFLQGSAAFFAAWLLGACSPKAPDSDTSATDRYDAFFSFRQAAEEIGHHYIDDYPAEALEDALKDMIDRSLGEVGSLTSADQEQLAELVRLAIRRDFKAGRTVTIDGWMLSVTEARLCALMALRH